MSQANSIRETFFEECQDLLEALDEGLNRIDDGAQDSEMVNAVFRAVHSIKGGAGAFGLTDLVSFAHTYETVFDEIRSDRLALEPSLIKVLFRGADHLAQLVEAARDESPFDERAQDSILADLNNYLGEEAEEEDIEFEPVPLALSQETPGQNRAFLISFTPHEALYKNGHDPLFLFRSLSEIGSIKVELDPSSLPHLNALDPADAYLRWSVSITTGQDEKSLREVFEFVEGLCDLSIEENGTPHVGLTECETSEFQANLVEREGQEPGAKSESKESRIAPHRSPQSVNESLSGTASEAQEKAKPPASSLRVDPERVDRLINTVGELIINQSMLAQRVSQLGQDQRRDIENDLEDYKLLARDIQEGVMAIRAQPVKQLFRRMARIAREAAHATNKLVQFETFGENTEVDKTVIEGLVDPLTHMIRNAVDHGVEPPDKRVEVGKPETGTISISASHRSGSVYIEISDDGAGLNRTKIFESAVQKGLIETTAELTGSEIDNLLFLPGFSTASEVSNLSGRGVGMDVVKNAVIALGGRTSIASTTGKGTTFSIVLPLTLAVMDGMVVTVGNQTMIVPIASIIETIRAKPNDLHELDANGQLLSVRGNYVPVVVVATRLNLSADRTNTEQVYILTETMTHGQVALAVDVIHDQRQVVVKSLEATYGRVPGVSAATILGDGKIAMILDPESLSRISETSSQRELLLQSRELEDAD